MNVAIYDEGTSDASLELETPNGDGDIVQEAEAFAMVGESVVKSASDVNADLVAESAVGGENGATRHQPKRFGEFGTVGNLQLEFFACREQTLAQFFYVEGSVNEENVFVTSRLRSDEVRRFGGVQLEQAVVGSLVLVGGKYVGADG
jgi:hypothetical protein